MLFTVHEHLLQWLQEYCSNALKGLNIRIPTGLFARTFQTLKIGRALYTAANVSRRTSLCVVNYQDDDDLEVFHPWIAEIQTFLYYNVGNCLEMKSFDVSDTHIYDGNPVFVFALVKWFNTPNSGSIIADFSINEGATFVLSSFAVQDVTCVVPVQRIAGRVILGNWNGDKRLAWAIKRRISMA